MCSTWSLVGSLVRSVRASVCGECLRSVCVQVAGHPGSVKGYVHIYHLVYSAYLSRLSGFGSPSSLLCGGAEEEFLFFNL